MSTTSQHDENWITRTATHDVMRHGYALILSINARRPVAERIKTVLHAHGIDHRWVTIRLNGYTFIFDATRWDDIPLRHQEEIVNAITKGLQ